MKHISIRLAAAASLLLGLSACGGQKTAVTPTPPTPTPAATAFQAKFGSAFAADFNASMDATPADPMASDVPALNLSAEPIDN